MLERRSHARVPLVARVEVEAEGYSFLAVTSNLSAGGLLIFTGNPAPAGERVQVTFLLPGSERPVRAAGVVRHVTPGTSMGVEFTALAADDREAIRRYAAQAAQSSS
jgi:uncharacterized protein (TIGR02266 family)